MKINIVNLAPNRQFFSAARDRENLTQEELLLELRADAILYEAGYDINGMPRYSNSKNERRL